METLSRRSFFAASAGAAGTAALLVAPGIATATGTEGKHGSSSKPSAGGGDGSDVIVHVRAGGKGEIVIYSGENEIKITDRNLAAAIARSAKGKG